LHTFLRALRGVHNAYLACYVALCEAIANARRIIFSQITPVRYWMTNGTMVIPECLLGSTWLIGVANAPVRQ
jgi:hypothetical protein